MPRGTCEEQDTVTPDVAREVGEASLQETAGTLDVRGDIWGWLWQERAVRALPSLLTAESLKKGHAAGANAGPSEPVAPMARLCTALSLHTEQQFGSRCKQRYCGQGLTCQDSCTSSGPAFKQTRYFAALWILHPTHTHQLPSAPTGFSAAVFPHQN